MMLDTRDHYCGDLEMQDRASADCHVAGFLSCLPGFPGKIAKTSCVVVHASADLSTEQSVPMLSLACSSASNSIAAGTELANYQASVLIWFA